MKRWIALAGCFAMWNAGAVPVGAIEVSRWPTVNMRIFVVAKGDCAQGPSTILVTDATTSCSIEVRVTPAKKYVDVLIFERVLAPTSYTPPPWIKTKIKFQHFYAPWIAGDGKVNMSSKGKGSAAILKKTSYGCVFVSGTAKVIVWATAQKAFSDGSREFVESKPITVTYQQSEGEIGCIEYGEVGSIRLSRG